jgi:hypothetical protein
MGSAMKCGPDETGSVIRLASPEGTSVLEPDLENTLWNLVSFGPQGAETPVIAGPVPITLLLAAGRPPARVVVMATQEVIKVDGNSIFIQYPHEHKTCLCRCTGHRARKRVTSKALPKRPANMK